MLTTYRRILAVPGALLFSATGLVGRLPISMQGLGIVLLVVNVTGSYAYAGAVAGATTVANAAATIFQGRAIDRLGQFRVLPALIVTWGAALALLIASVQGEWPRWSVFAARIRYVGRTRIRCKALVTSPAPERARIYAKNGSNFIDCQPTIAPLQKVFNLESVDVQFRGNR